VVSGWGDAVANRAPGSIRRPDRNDPEHTRLSARLSAPGWASDGSFLRS
jgi:hypothetical protein